MSMIIDKIYLSDVLVSQHTDKRIAKRTLRSFLVLFGNLNAFELILATQNRDGENPKHVVILCLTVLSKHNAFLVVFEEPIKKYAYLVFLDEHIANTCFHMF